MLFSGISKEVPVFSIVRSIDIMALKEYNYEYSDGTLVRATECDITLSGEIVTSKTLVNTVRYYFDTDGKMTKKVVKPTGVNGLIYFICLIDYMYFKYQL